MTAGQEKVGTPAGGRSAAAPGWWPVPPRPAVARPGERRLAVPGGAIRRL